MKEIASPGIRSVLIPVLEFTRSGGNRVLSRLASEWKKRGVQVEFLVEWTDSKPYFPTTAGLSFCGSGRKGLDIGLSLLRRLHILLRILNLARGIRSKKPASDLIFASYSFTAISCFLAGCRSNTIYYIQGYDPEIFATKRTLSAWIAASLARLSYTLCRKQIVNSEHYLSYPAVTARVAIPPGIDLDIFRPKDKPGEISSEIVRVGIVGRAERHKFRPALAAYRELLKTGVRTKLLVAYDLIPRQYLEETGEYEVITPGDDIELASFYRKCDVFLALSDFPQGAFYPPLEALASGTSLISNRFFLVSSQNSWIVDSQTHIDELFLSLCRDAPQRIEKATTGIRDVRKIAWPAVAKDFLAEAERLLGKG